MTPNVQSFFENLIQSKAYKNMPIEFKRGYSYSKAHNELNADQTEWQGAEAKLSSHPLSTTELAEVYIILLNMFRGMDNDKGSFYSNEDAKKFLSKHFKAGGLFQPFTIDTVAIDPLVQATSPLMTALLANVRIASQLNMTPVQYGAWLAEIQTDPSKLNDKENQKLFKSAISILKENNKEIDETSEQIGYYAEQLEDAEKELKKAKSKADKDDARENVSDIKRQLRDLGLQAKRVGLAIPDLKAHRHTPSNLMTEIDTVENILIKDTAANVPAAFTQDKAEEILGAIAEKKDIRDAALPKMDGNAASVIYTNITKTNYKDGDNKIVPKPVSNKRIFNRATTLIKSGANNYIGKYLSKEKRKMMPDSAGAIYDEIKKLQIKSTGGLGEILKNADKIKGNLSGTTAKSFDWMIKALKSLESTDQFKDGLSHGGQLSALVRGINRIAAKEGEGKTGKELTDIMDKARNAQFLLDAMSYGATTSSIRDNLRKADINLTKGTSLEKVMGGSLSWAINTTFKVGFFAAFELLNLGKNVVHGNTNLWRRGMSQANTKKAMEQVGNNPTRDYKGEFETAQRLWEDADRNGDKNAGKLEKRMKQAELLVMAKERYNSNKATEEVRNNPGNDRAYYESEYNLASNNLETATRNYENATTPNIKKLLEEQKRQAEEKKQYAELLLGMKEKYDKTADKADFGKAEDRNTALDLQMQLDMSWDMIRDGGTTNWSLGKNARKSSKEYFNMEHLNPITGAKQTEFKRNLESYSKFWHNTRGMAA